MKSELTQERLKQLLHYDGETGVFTWIVNRKGPARIGDIAGTLVSTKKKHTTYVRLEIGVDGNRYKAHRLAWLYEYGVMPTHQIDHVDRNPLNNRIGNLREVTNKQNAENRGLLPNNTSGYKGVCYSKQRQKWVAHIHHNGLQIHIGVFNSPEEASAAYEKMAGILFTHYKKAA